jgi:glycosyltransferase involved in cell wall biosynthesis
MTDGFMRILWVAHRDPINPRAGGAERIIHEVGVRLTNRGHQLSVLACGWKNSKKYENLDGIHIMRVGSHIGPHLALPIYILKNKYDIVIADLGHAIPWISPVLLKTKTIVLFHHLHARSLQGQVGRLFAYLISAVEKLYFIIYNKSPFVTVSNTSFVDLKILGIKDGNISIINPGVDNILFRPSIKTNDPSIVYFGGMRPYKRPEESLYLLKELRKEISNLKLTLIGVGPSMHELARLCTELDLSRNVVFTGRISDSEVAEVVAAAWLNIHTSVTEGWGISIIEAASAGTPTIAYNVPGVSDSVENGINGITVKNRNRKELVDAALNVLRSPQRWWASSLEVANKYSWDKTAELWETLIQEVADRHCKKPILVKS